MIRTLPLLLVACATDRVTGFIDGASVDVGSLWWTFEPAAFEGVDGRLTITLTSLPTGCSAFEYWRAQSTDVIDPGALASAWSAAFPQDWWQVEIRARTDGDTWPEQGKDWIGVPFGEPLDGPVQVRAAFTHHIALRDAAFFDPSAEVGLEAYATEYGSDLGISRWDRVRPGDRIAGRFNTFAVTRDGERVGTVESQYAAFGCEAAAGGL